MVARNVFLAQGVVRQNITLSNILKTKIDIYCLENNIYNIRRFLCSRALTSVTQVHVFLPEKLR